MKYHWIDRQTVEYRVLHCMELGCTQAWQIVLKLMATPEALGTSQIANALQRLRRDGIVKCDGKHWDFTDQSVRAAAQKDTP